MPLPSPSTSLLVVEDDRDTLTLYTIVLNMHGYQVIPAASGQAALRQLASAPIHGVILDRRLPDADGLEVCRQLHERLGPAVPIVVVSVDHDPGAAARAGATALIPKPFAVEELLQQLHTLVGAERRTDSHVAGCGERSARRAG